MPKQSQYFMKDALPLLYSAYCLNIVLKESEKARKILDAIIELLHHPEVQLIISQFQNALPPPKKTFEILQDETLKQTLEAAKSNDYWSPDLKFFGGFLNKVSQRGFGPVKKWFAYRKAEGSHNFNELITLASELIRIGFNRDPSNPKVTADSAKFLPSIIMAKAYSAVLGAKITIDDKEFLVEVRGVPYDLSKLLPGPPTTRAYRRRIQKYKQAGYVLKHLDTIVFDRLKLAGFIVTNFRKKRRKFSVFIVSVQTEHRRISLAQK